jgi:uncharacterized phiE125 gp8 family phage protein
MPGWQLISGPAIEPLSLDELKAHLRITNADASRDADLFRKLKAARRYVEDRTGPLLEQQWAMWSDDFPSSYFDIPRRPILSVDGLFSIDDDGVETEVDAEDTYYTDLYLGRIFLRTGAVWPTLYRTYQGAKVLVTLGYGATPDAVPPALVEAVAKMTAHFDLVREAYSEESQDWREAHSLMAAYEPAAV